MKTLLKNIGLVILFIGVGITAYTSSTTVSSNTGLITGAILMIVGLIGYILINRYID